MAGVRIGAMVLLFVYGMLPFLCCKLKILLYYFLFQLVNSCHFYVQKLFNILKAYVLSNTISKIHYKRHIFFGILKVCAPDMFNNLTFKEMIKLYMRCHFFFLVSNIFEGIINFPLREKNPVLFKLL